MLKRIACKLGYGSRTPRQFSGAAYYLTDVRYTTENIEFTTCSLFFAFSIVHCACGNHDKAEQREYRLVERHGSGKISRALLRELLPTKHNRELRAADLIDCITGEFLHTSRAAKDFCEKALPDEVLSQKFGILRREEAYRHSPTFSSRNRNAQLAFEAYAEVSGNDAILDRYERIVADHNRLREVVVSSFSRYLE